MKKFFAGLGLAAACLFSGNLWAVPDSNVGDFDVEVYDTGGQLNFANNGGFYLNGLEVDPAGGTVYVAASDAIFGGTSSVVRLIGSTGPGTAFLDASGTQLLSYTTRGVDLTYLSGSYYVAACAPAGIPNKGSPCSGIPGIYGFTPGGGQPTYASGGSIPGWATSGLTFNAGGASALVTSDVGIGHWNVTPPSTGTLLVNNTPLPGGYVDSGDDHVVTLDGRVLIMADGGSAIYDVTGGPGSVFLFFDMTAIPGFPGCGVVGPPPKSEAYSDKQAKGGPCFGSRGTVDPVTGDIFYAYAVGGATIFRITSNGAFGEVFATGFVDGVVDIDFGPASDGGGDFSLYATEVAGIAAEEKGTGGPVGSIYEFVRINRGPIPTLSVWGKLAMILALLGIAGYMLSRRQRGLA